MNIDSHQHFWRYDAARDTWITDAMQVIKRDFLTDDLAAEMKASGIDASVAVQTVQSVATWILRTWFTRAVTRSAAR